MDGPAIFQALTWDIRDEEFENSNIVYCYVHGRLVGKKSVHKIPGGYKSTFSDSITVKLSGLHPWFYLEPPDAIKKSSSKLKLFMDFLRTRKFAGQVPYSVSFIKKQKTLNLAIERDLLKIEFCSLASTRAARNFFTQYPNSAPKSVFFNGESIPVTEFYTHETAIDQLLKIFIKKGIDFSGFCSLKNVSLQSGKDYGCSSDYYVQTSIKNLSWEKEPLDIPDVTYLMVDIEQYSENYDSRLPDSSADANMIFQIGVIFGKINESKPIAKYMITLFDPNDIEDVTIFRCKNESQLLLAFAILEGQLNPDVVMHYNGLNYDLKTIYERSKLLKISDSLRSKMSRYEYAMADEKRVNWSTKAFGKFSFVILDAQRIQLDLQVEIERNYKLPSYALKAVAEKFLDENKDDVTYRQLFMFVDITRKYLNMAKRLERDFVKVPRWLRTIIKQDIIKMFPARYASSVAKKLRENLLTWTTSKDFLFHLRQLLTISAKYCLQDCNVTFNLAYKFNTWEGYLALAKVSSVPISYIQGQNPMSKVCSVIFKKCNENNIVINDFRDKKFVPYQGAYVVDGIPGYYENIFTEDFFSLYPTNIISACMDYTTHVPDPSTRDPDDLVQISWESHENCKHTGKKINAKKPEICGKQTFYFEKIKFDENGKPINEGILPSLLRDGLNARNQIKYEMAVYEVAVRCYEGRLENPEKDLAFFKNNCKSFGIEYFEKPKSIDEEVYKRYKKRLTTLNARQLAVKVSLNSVYGGTGAQFGPVPAVHIAASITAMARNMINKVIDYGKELYRDRKIFLVYGDTDSCMFSLPGADAKTVVEIGEEFSKKATHMIKCYIMNIPHTFKISLDGKSYTLDAFPKDRVKELDEKNRQLVYRYNYIPTKLNFEKYFPTYLFLTKKRYIANVANLKGQIIEFVKKGCVLQRRDNPNWLKKHYGIIVNMMTRGATKEEVYSYVYDAIRDLWTCPFLDSRHPNKLFYDQFIIPLGVKDLLSYAVKNKATGKFVDRHTGEDFEPRYQIINGFSVPDPLDDRLEYRKLKQISLLKKYKERNTNIPSNTRIEYVMIEMPEKTPDCEKAEDYTYFKENRKEKGLTLDLMYYLDRQFQAPIGELVSIRYRGDLIVHYSEEEFLQKLVTSEVEQLILKKQGELGTSWKYVKYHSLLKRPKISLSTRTKIDVIMDCQRISKKHLIDEKSLLFLFTYTPHEFTEKELKSPLFRKRHENDQKLVKARSILNAGLKYTSQNYHPLFCDGKVDDTEEGLMRKKIVSTLTDIKMLITDYYKEEPCRSFFSHVCENAPGKLKAEDEELLYYYAIYHLRNEFVIVPHYPHVKELDASEIPTEEVNEKKCFLVKNIISDQLLNFALQKISELLLNKMGNEKYKRYDHKIGRHFAMGKTVVNIQQIVSDHEVIPVLTPGVIVTSQAITQKRKVMNKEIEEVVMYEYSVSFTGHGIIKNIKGHQLRIYRNRDQYFLEDITFYRKVFKRVIKQLQKN